MAVYVDDMYLRAIGQFGRMKMSHMIADYDHELHAMADTIGLQRRWYQGDHYDLSIKKRTAAIAAGAIPVTMRQLAAMSYLRRCGRQMGDPRTAVQRMMETRSARKGAA